MGKSDPLSPLGTISTIQSMGVVIQGGTSLKPGKCKLLYTLMNPLIADSSQKLITANWPLH